ncbi:hypothetical protein SKM52_03525 [Acinetobacter faecalis]|uniref:hypothetical protein n=1 Tax=Acinetobacter faecalis TaxID=2665161 RepID=UPI002A916FD5|nr:hypothetical protein [Acinetobacter faecalis]MDY6523619.1 hypothetical protein [Acinetobacter faecalis]
MFSIFQVKRRTFIRRVVVLMVKKGGGYVQRSPRLKYFVLRFFNHLPGLAIKLREIHLKSKFSIDQTSVGDMGGDTSMTNTLNDTSEYLILKQPVLNGINENHKTPLEKNYQMYGIDK